MKDKIIARRRQQWLIQLNGRLCVATLGVLLTGLVHGAVEDELGEDCRWSQEQEGLRQQKNLECVPINSEESGSKRDTSDQGGQATDAVEPAQGEHSPSQDTGESKSIEDSPPIGNYEDIKQEDALATDAAEAYVDSTAIDAVDVADDDIDIVDSEEDVVLKTETGGEVGEENGTVGIELVDDQQPAIDESDNRTAQQIAVDGSALQINSSTAGPEDIELFRVDNEATPLDEELPVPNERDLFGLSPSFMKTSDDYEARAYSFSYRNHRRGWFWPWQEATIRGLDWGVDVDRTTGDTGATEFDARHMRGMLGGYLTPGTYLSAQLGRHTLQTDQGDRDITSRHVAAMFGLKDNFSLELETGRDFIYAEGSVTGGITKQLTAVEHSVSFRWRPQLRLRFQGQSGYRKHDDDNEARFADISALYGIYTEWPWVWLGFGGQQLNYQTEVDDYWSPDLYKAYGLRFESSFPLTKRLAGSASASLNRLDENGSHGNGYDIRGGLQYRLFGHLYGRIELHKSRSIQQSSTWTADSVSFSLSGPLF